jgi:putative acetyltransferase
MPQITIAEAGPRLDEVRSLFREYAESLDFDLGFQDFDAELAGLPGDYAPPSGRLLLATVDGRAAGCVALRRLDPETCEMKRLFVRPDFRGHGIGRMLIEQILGEARRAGYRRMRLDTVAGSMAEATRLYRAAGFRPIPPYRHNPMVGAIFLEIDLTGQAAAT